MTITALDIERMKNILSGEASSRDSAESSSGTSLPPPISGKVLAERLKGLLSNEEADELERLINESCENEND